jgi:sec-independent protein translocase protein TatA
VTSPGNERCGGEFDLRYFARGQPEPESQGKRERQGELDMLGGMSWIHWLIVLAVVLLLFGGRGKITQVMGDFAKGINAFKKGLKEEDKTKAADAENAKVIEQDKAAS